MRTTVHVLTYMAALPQSGSPLIFPTRPCSSKAVQDLAYIPGWREEAKWRLLGKNGGVCVGGGGANKQNLVCSIPSKHITYLFPNPGASVEVREKS
jgi:hypothetical protein